MVSDLKRNILEKWDFNITAKGDTAKYKCIQSFQTISKDPRNIMCFNALQLLIDKVLVI